MNTLSKNKEKELSNKLKSLLEFDSPEDKLDYEASVLHIKIIDVILELMEQNKINKATLAKELNTSKSYITQLFSAEKLINLKLLSKLQNIFNVKFDFITHEAIDNYNEQHNNIFSLNNEYIDDYDSDSRFKEFENAYRGTNFNEQNKKNIKVI